MKALLFVLLVSVGSTVVLGQNTTKPKSSPATQLPTKTLAEQLGLPKESQTAQQNNRIELRSDPLAIPQAGPSTLPDRSEPLPTSGGAIKIETEIKTQEIFKDERPRYSGDLNRFFLFETGYVDSKWKQFSGRLDRGSLSIRVGVGRKYSDLFEGEIAYFMIRGLQKTNSPTPVYAETFNGSGRFVFFDGPIFLTAGLGVHLGAYKVWSLAAESEHNVTYTKHAGGSVFGGEPQIGMRMAFSPHFKTDLNISYLAFVDAPEFKMGGWAANLRLTWFFPERN